MSKTKINLPQKGAPERLRKLLNDWKTKEPSKELIEIIRQVTKKKETK